jgi:hypothetical protein
MSVRRIRESAYGRVLLVLDACIETTIVGVCGKDETHVITRMSEGLRLPRGI